MSAFQSRDCTDFNRAVSPELRADLGLALDLARHAPHAAEIVPVMQRVARAVAAERVRPEEMIVCVKSLWTERRDVPSAWLPADGTWLALVRIMIEAYYLAVDVRPVPTETVEPLEPLQ